jgi:putative flippase GtrA
MKALARLAAVYAFISLLGSVANLLTQATVVATYSGPYAIELSVLVGTFMGYPIKYVLEKKHVFGFEAQSLGHDSRLFMLYGVMGVFTTLVFWGVEFAFQYAFGTDTMRYLGGVIGLTLGAIIKYNLDKRFVFKQVVV